MEVEELLRLLKGHKVRFVIIGATAFPVHASLDDLIHMKQAAGRPKDKEDLRVLRRLQQRKLKRRS